MAARATLLDVLRREPRQFGVQRPRWRLGDLLTQLDGWHLQGPTSLSRLLRRLRISFQQGRRHVHSPDLNYQPKRQAAEQRELVARLAAQEAGWDGWRPPAVVLAPRRQVTLLQDELTYERQPSLARALASPGRDAHGRTHPPLAELSHRSNTETRVAATLDVISGQVVWCQSSRIGVADLVALYQDVRATYPEAARIWLIQDNWPVHWHADLLVALEPQQTRWPPTRPPSWSAQPSRDAQQRWGHLQLPIQLVFLPTYASWLNPIEKLWRWLKQAILHLHRLADDLPALRAQVAAFLSRFIPGSQEAATLLR